MAFRPRQNRALDADGARPAVKVDVDLVAEVGDRVLDPRGARPAADVGAGRRDGQVGLPQQGPRDGVRGDADGDGAQPA
jgi:hypothetical protein